MPLRLRVSANAFVARPIQWSPTPRHYCVGAPFSTQAFSAVRASPRLETFTVPCRSNGSITVDVFHAEKSGSHVVIYLPPGPTLPSNPEEEDVLIATLNEHSEATIARINYRASTIHQYPTPIHDALAGYDWVRDTLLRDALQRPYLTRLGVCGELVGGSLGAMLALTECRSGETRVGAAAVNSPLVDWVFPDELPLVDPSDLPEPLSADETAFPAHEDLMSSAVQRLASGLARKSRKRSVKAAPLTEWQRYSNNSVIPTSTLVAKRDALFRRPDDWFDRFASPIHFFRSPHAQMVLPQSNDVSASRQPDKMLDIEIQMSIDHYTDVGSQTPVSPELPTLTRCRSYARNYPLVGTKISLPAWHVSTGAENPLSDQAKEFTKMLRRSVARHTLKFHAGRTRWHDTTEKQMYEEAAEDRVRFESHPGLGLWSGSVQRMQEVGSWMKECLDVGAN
ncbi:alpha/beta-hydrolase [Setomelanomma holmii]|uniref:Alpha/beta-hydrolase n=1 Tax=Setomelanomma holmii TaxID=210430 RepID=A0A9P4H8V1_9PLEO|nr:alpha/beta-hydrolase [Setomelanomma holmii]